MTSSIARYATTALLACLATSAAPAAGLGVLAPVLERGEPLQRSDSQGRPAPVVTRVTEGALFNRLQQEATAGFTATMLRLDEAAQRTAGGQSIEPTWLYLSTDEGGFARKGFWLDEHGSQRYIAEPFVDLVVDADSVESGDFEEIFAHELGHVFLRRLLPRLPEGYSRTAHSSLSITDYPTAFDEGFAIHFQGLARRLTRNEKLRNQDLGLASKPFLSYWASNLDRAARIDGVRRNWFVQLQVNPAASGDNALAERDQSTLFDTAQLKNGNQMLASEGVIATLFYRWLVPGSGDPQAIVQRYTRLFAALVALNKHEILPDSPVFLDVLERYGALYPDRLAASLNLFVDTTYGATVDARIAAQTESLAHLGRSGDERYIAALKEARISLSELHEKVVKIPTLLRAALGPDIWLLARAEPALAVNLNTAELEQLEALPGVDAIAAQRALDSRQQAGAFRDLDDFVARSGLSADVAAGLQAQVSAMQRAGTYSRR